MNILLTNDDGIHASGLRAIYNELVKLGHNVFPFAPTIERSGASNSVSLNVPLTTQDVYDGDFKGTAINGTPVDCVKVGLAKLHENPPDLIISGINAGHNVGTDILYSGTVAAAIEGCVAGIPSIAFSRPREEVDPTQSYAEHAANLLKKIDFSLIPKGQTLNINYPSISIKKTLGIKVCTMSSQGWEHKLHKKKGDNGKPYWLISPYIPYSHGIPQTDVFFLLEGWITITPLMFNMTAQTTLSNLEQYSFT